MAPFEGYDLPAHRVHMATLAGGVKFIADLQDEEPHLLIAAGTGGGKTSAASVPAAHTRAHGLAGGHHRPQTPVLHRPQNRE